MIDVPRISVSDFNVDWFTAVPAQHRRSGNQSKRELWAYKDIVTAFDIETSYVPAVDQAAMYVWQWDFDNRFTVIGRTWEEFKSFVKLLCDSLPDRCRLVVLVHNLSYEFQFIRGELNFEPDDVFAVAPRKVLKATYNRKIEFRCTYLHSNMSLDLYCRKMKCEHQKLSGEEFDYNAIRYPWTELTDRQLDYCQLDVVSLVEAYKREMAVDDDNLYTIPLTSTGYVRRDAKRAMQRTGPCYIQDQLPNFHIYSMEREAFRGGNTHGNRYYAGYTLHDVSSADRSSSYPDTICNCKFPISSFIEVGECSVDELEDLVFKKGKAVLMRVKLIGNIHLTNKYNGAPYIPRDKCRQIINGIYDNGRVLSADYIDITLTDIDLKIILHDYSFDTLVPYDVAYARYGDLPGVFVRTVCDYYDRKTILKGSDKGDDPVLYDKAKAKLNALYGLMAQDPVKATLRYQGLYSEEPWEYLSEKPEDLLFKSNRTAFLNYAHGCWVTAWARLRLQEGIWLAGDKFVYCDTDSVKYLDNVDFTEYNNDRITASIKSGAHCKDSKGEEHYMGVFEYEGTYDKFRTLGAKKYCYEKDGKLHITVAGVNKKDGATELAENGGIEAFTPGFIFRKAGGVEACYNDSILGDVDIDGHRLRVGTNVCLKPSTYALGITEEYARLLDRSRID